MPIVVNYFMSNGFFYAGMSDGSIYVDQSGVWQLVRKPGLPGK